MAKVDNVDGFKNKFEVGRWEKWIMWMVLRVNLWVEGGKGG